MQQISKNIYSSHPESFSELVSKYRKDGTFGDGAKVCVLIEGGALRGVVSAGYAKALAEIVSPNAFHSLYGSSSGALNSIYFLCDLMDVALSIYAENATDKRCTNILKFPNILNVDWLIDEWIFGAKKFPVDKVIGSSTNTFISLTRLEDGRPAYFNGATATPNTLNQAMKATSYAPLLSNGEQTIGGVRYGDGAVADAIPYEKAIADGCTHIICLLTRPHGYQKQRDGFSNKLLARLRLAHHTAAFRTAFHQSDKDYNVLLRALHNGQDLRTPTLVICPADGSEIPSNVETRPPIIAEKGAFAYREASSQLAKLFAAKDP